MAKRKIYARKLIKEFDILHLAKEFYRYTIRFPDLEADTKWKQIKEFAEDFLVIDRCKRENNPDFSPEDFRDFLRFYTRLEAKHYDEERKFIFSENDKDFFLSLKSIAKNLKDRILVMSSNDKHPHPVRGCFFLCT